MFGSLIVDGQAIKQGHMSDAVYNGMVSTGKSILTDWVNKSPLFSDINVAVGPVTLTFGKGQALFQVGQNIPLIVNAVNLAAVGGADLLSDLFPSIKQAPKVELNFTAGGYAWTQGGYLGALIGCTRTVGFLNSIPINIFGQKFAISIYNFLNNYVSPGDGILTSNANEEFPWNPASSFRGNKLAYQSQ
jgi:hypothetical protein